AYHDILEMRLDPGMRIANQEAVLDPGNLIPAFLENYADFFRLFFSEDPDLMERLEPVLDQRLSQLEGGDRHSPYYLYCLGTVHFQRALIAIKFGSHITAALQIRKSYLELKENQKDFPSFGANQMLLGSMETVIGTIPSGYQWAVRILGLSGTIAGGMQDLESFLKDTDREARIFQEEGSLYYGYLDFSIANHPVQALKFLQGCPMDPTRNELFAMVLINLAMNRQMGAYAEQVYHNLEMDSSYFHVPLLDLESGTLEMDRLQLDSSLRELSKYAFGFKGNFYVSDALLRMSWDELLKGEKARAAQYLHMILERKNSITDADKAARLEARRGRLPNGVLLRARLLSDGGYFDQAMDLIQGLHVSDFPDPADKVEWVYRMGRIEALEGKTSEAIVFYDLATRIGGSGSAYFAARAALELGGIYEKGGQKDKALLFYRKCLDMHEQEYKDYLDQLAKAGINRITGD
ncbi:MAG TPA: tetratricopeptide repeat protein, partial [Chitinophagaceae bacterium]|nr:tetratricopeptide repeat protein [Chitinophagaceae bacterium]